MTIEFTKSEIKQFLEEQGFDVEDEDTLKSFIKDLKKLIKYEEMKKRRHRLGHHPEETVLDTTEDSSRMNHTTGETSTSSGGHPHHNQQHHPHPQHHPHDHSRDHRPPPSSTSRSTTHRHPQQPTRPSPRRSPPRSVKKSPEKTERPQHGRSSRSSSPSPVPPRKRSQEKSFYPDEGASVVDNRSGLNPNDKSSGASVHTLVEKQRSEWKSKRIKPFTNSSKSNASSRGRVKKPASRLIMNRITATTDDNGEAVLHESQVDLGPTKRPENIRNQRSRPHTAPARSFKKPFLPMDNSQYKREGESRGREERIRKPLSARLKESSMLSRQPTASASAQDGAAEEHGGMKPDELFYVLREIMFPDDQSGTASTGDSLFSEKPKTKKLIQPPPHVAIDPVALFHWYKKNSWDVHAIPGEDRHMKLRWNVRAKTIGGFHQCV